eukprot:12971971-Alexandrium_andersonii.AAC.1
MPASSASPERSAIVFCAVGQRSVAHVGRRAPSKVGAHERADSTPLILPRETVGCTGLQRQ